MNSLRDDPLIRALLDDLHGRSTAEESTIDAYYRDGAARPTGYESADSASRRFWRDKFVALDRDKAELAYSMCRATGARRIVEAGTSFGVSTIYLAAAVRDNGGGMVITCDNEPDKVARAEKNFERAGVRPLIDCRVGDIGMTLRDLDEPVDALLLDIWAPIAGDVLALVGPHLRIGGVVLADNTASRRNLYQSLFDQLDDPANGFTTQTLPYSGGFELAVKTSPSNHG